MHIHLKVFTSEIIMSIATHCLLANVIQGLP